MFSSMLSLLGSLKGGSSFITNSLRFRSSASAYLSRTPSVAGNRKTWTWSAWVKRGRLGVSQEIFTSGYILNGSPTPSMADFIEFNSSDKIYCSFGYTGAVNAGAYTSNAVFRDPSAWYHIVITIDTTNATAANRFLLYVNGVNQSVTATTTFALNAQTATNTNNPMNIGRTVPDAFGGVVWNYFDGYLAEVNFIDGQALTPSSFGQTDTLTGVWTAKKYTGTYGTNGFYLKFANTSSVAALGTDSSGNGNTWTVNNVSLTAGATYDSMIDVPVNYADGGNGRGNYCTLNPVRNTNSNQGSIIDGNLRVNGSSGSINCQAAGTLAVSGKAYWETIITIAGLASISGVGIRPASSVEIGTAGLSTNGIFYLCNGSKRVTGATSAYAASYTNGDIIGIAVDADAETITFYKNNISQGSISGTGVISLGVVPFIGFDDVNSPVVVANFGQRPFTYTPPAGFRALNTNNLPTPSIVNGANFMAATTYTGNAAVRSLSNAVNSVSFQPDLVWIKSRTPGATSHALFDSVRGTTKYLSSDTTAAETTNANTLTAFGADGFSLGNDTTLVNANANSYIAWQWRESITAGLDIVSYTGTNVNRTVAHNLGVAPAMIIVKRSQTGATSNWQVRHTSIPVANSIQLNSVAAAAAATTVWNSTAPTSSEFSLGTSTDVNSSGIAYVAYCFAEIAGFSKFGSYTGNGSADGPFVFCGFRPRFVMVKRFDTGSVEQWNVIDTARDTYNAATNGLIPNGVNVEFTGAAIFDFVSNGFKVKYTGSPINASGGTYIFAAFAETPSKYALAR